MCFVSRVENGLITSEKNLDKTPAVEEKNGLKLETKRFSSKVPRTGVSFWFRFDCFGRDIFWGTPGVNACNIASRSVLWLEASSCICWSSKGTRFFNRRLRPSALCCAGTWLHCLDKRGRLPPASSRHPPEPPSLPHAAWHCRLPLPRPHGPGRLVVDQLRADVPCPGRTLLRLASLLCQSCDRNVDFSCTCFHDMTDTCEMFVCALYMMFFFRLKKNCTLCISNSLASSKHE